MKRTQILVTSTALTLLAGVTAAQAQEEDKAPSFSPIETYTCNYNDGMGPADLDAVISDWNDYMDEQGADNYFAATLTPYYYGPETFDIGWVGAADSAEALGAGADMYAKTGGKIGAAFNKVLTCDTHSNFAAMLVKAPPKRESPDNLVVSFSDCSATDGKSMDDVFTAMAAWTEYQNERGYQSGAWAWFPVFGGGGESTFDFKLVEAHDNHAGLGKDWDLYADGDYDKHGEIMGGVLTCDVARVYDAKIVRQTADDSAD